MRSYQVHLESSTEGLFMAHVDGLPGCFARGDTRTEALDRLPGAIAAYQAWLARHGEVVPGNEPTGSALAIPRQRLEIQVVGESKGLGPFDPGDAAALFPPDRQPVTTEEMEAHFRLSGHARSDLLALARPLPEALLDWQPYPDWFSIRRVLRHVGDAEEWYVSRLVPPETLPPEWADDADLPLFAFLEMERRMAIDRLRALTPEERLRVFTPSVWTHHPEEAWTLRKVLRRFLEHEREHTSQVRQILGLFRHGLLASLAAGQTALLEPLLGLDEAMLTAEAVVGGRTARDLIADLAAWDWGELQAMARGESSQLFDPSLRQDTAGHTASDDRRTSGSGPGLGDVVAELEMAQKAWLAWLEAVPEEGLFQREPWGSAVEAAVTRWRRLEEHAELLVAWKKGLDHEPGAPSAAVLRAALGAGRRELVAAACLIRSGEWSRPVCGTWTLQDVVGHVADWEFFGGEGLRHMATGPAMTPLPVERIDDIDVWNEARAAARRGQAWEEVWADFLAARQSLMTTLEGMEEATLTRRFPFPWGGEGTPYDWLCVYLLHDREHAAGLCAALTLPAIYSCS